MPRLFPEDVEGLVNFLKAAFEAQGELELDRPTELLIGDTVLMIADGGGIHQPTSSAFYIYVNDVENAWKRAVKPGAESYREPEDTPWNDRRVIVNDQWGNHWQIAKHRGASQN